VIGAPGDSNFEGTKTGALYYYRRNVLLGEPLFEFKRRVIPCGLPDGAGLGWRLTLSNNTAFATGYNPGTTIGGESSTVVTFKFPDFDYKL